MNKFYGLKNDYSLPSDSSDAINFTTKNYFKTIKLYLREILDQHPKYSYSKTLTKSKDL